MIVSEMPRKLTQREIILIVTTLSVCALFVTQSSAQTTLSPNDKVQTSSKPSERIDFHAVRGRAPLMMRADRYEGELDLSKSGDARVQGLENYGDQWSGNAHLLWDGGVGTTMETSFELESAGVYDIAIQLTVAPDYGLFDIDVAGHKLDSPVDLYGTKVDLAPLVKLDGVRLPAGTQRLDFKLIGSNPKARKFKDGYLLGVDYLQLTRKGKPPQRPPALSTNKLADANSHRHADALPFGELKAVMNQFCFKCHGGGATEADLDLTAVTRRNTLLDDIDGTRLIRDAVAQHEMPPEENKQPTPEVRAKMVATFDAVVDEYLSKHRIAAPIVMRRLNRYEYNNAVRDLLKLRGDIYPLPEKTIRSGQTYFDPASGRFPNSVLVGNRTLGKNQVERQILTGVSPFAIDLQAEGGFNNRGRELSMSPILLESFLKLGQSIVSSPEFDDYCGTTHSFLTVPNDLNTDEQEQVARKRLASFLEVAFRNEVEESVIERYHRYFVRRLSETKSYSQSMKEVAAAVLASPKFIYISESTASKDESILSSYELATRLSFFLWSSIPDEQLLAAARDGSLTQPAVLDAQVRRMLKDPRCQALSQNFARQWLRLDQLVTAVPDFDRFPQYYSRIGCEQWKFGLQTMIEPLLLFESIMVEDRSIMLLVDCNYAYRSDELQSWYDDKVPFGARENRERFNTNQQQYRKRQLTDRRHGGVITSAATLTMTSAPLRTSPITRGAWVATVVFNDPPPPPPDDVPPIEADDKAIESRGLTLRQRLQQHQVNQSCKSCHAKIDPLGFALENFDAVGRWRDSYTSGLDIDASGVLFGTRQFMDVVGMKDALLEHPESFMRAFCEHMLSYALGRELELEDALAVDKIVASVVADHGQFSTVVRQIAQSYPFRYQARQTDERESK